jgi:DNA-binding transcriptional ArsR family regulator
MKEHLQIAKHANLVDEAFLILYQWANKDAFDQMKEEYRNNYLDNPDRYNHIWDTILVMYEAVKEELKPKRDRIDYYFKSQNINFFFPASFAFLWDFQNIDNKLLTYEERFRDLKEEDRIKAYAQIVNIDEEDGAPVEGLHTYDDFLRFLDEAVCPKDVKWEVLHIFHNQKKCYDEVAAILKEVIDLLENKFREQIAKLEQQFYDYWTEMQGNKDIIELVQQNLKLTWEKKERGTVLLPMIFHPVSVTFSYQPDGKVTDVLRLGILLDQRFNTARHKMDSEDIVNFGKLLSDKSKVDILDLTAKKPCYGKEIAKELNLTTATISYHVNALMRLGLLKTELISNRVYYCMNFEKLSEYLEDIKGFYNKK